MSNLRTLKRDKSIKKKTRKSTSKYKSIIDFPEKTIVDPKKTIKKEKAVIKYQKYLTKLKSSKSKSKQRTKKARNTLLLGESKESRNNPADMYFKGSTLDDPRFCVTTDKSTKDRGSTSRRLSKLPTNKFKELRPGVMYKNSVIINNPENVCQVHLSSIDKSFNFLINNQSLISAKASKKKSRNGNKGIGSGTNSMSLNTNFTPSIQIMIPNSKNMQPTRSKERSNTMKSYGSKVSKVCFV